MPVFCWTALASNLLIVAAFPVLTATLAMLLLDRYLGFHFFTVDAGGNPMMYVNLFWVWGHPEVYILILPAFGIFSEVVATFSGKPLFGYRSMVAATMAICVLSFIVWLHHFFTMGASANVNGFFGVMTMIIAVPTGVKVFNWLFTMYGGRVRFTVPILWSIGFMVTFVIGGMTGVLMAVPPADFQLHNSLFLSRISTTSSSAASCSACMAGYNYWFPKAFGFKLDERWGKASFWCWLIGFYRRLHAALRARPDGHDPAHAALRQPGLAAVAASWRRSGAVIILAGIVCQVVQLVVSIRDREQLRDRDRRSVERPHAGMVDRLAAAGLEFRRAAAGRRAATPSGAGSNARARSRLSRRRAQVRADRNAEEQRDRLRQRILCRRHRLRPDLAHLVDGGSGTARRIRDDTRLRVSR